jgi:hypothetical protein
VQRIVCASAKAGERKRSLIMGIGYIASEPATEQGAKCCQLQPHCAKDLWREPQEQEQEDCDQPQRHLGMLERYPHPGGNQGVFKQAQSNVRERLRAVIYRQSRCRFRAVASQRNAAANHDQHGLHHRVEVSEGCRSQHRCSDGADEGVERVPKAVEPGNLVGRELHQARQA